MTLSTGLLLSEVAKLHVHLQRNLVASCCGMTETQCTLLTELGRVSPMTLARLSRRIGFDKSWTSRTIEHLVQKGLVEKVPSQIDRRTIQLSLSKSGEECLCAINQTLSALADQTMESIPQSEHENIHQALGWIQKALLNLTKEKQLSPALQASEEVAYEYV